MSPLPPHKSRTTDLLALVLLATLIGELLLISTKVLADYVAAISSPVQIDYAEGIVWQQALLIPGPRMYGTSPSLPFIVCNYPPLYYMLCRAALPFFHDFLAAGRFVSVLSSLSLAPMTAALVLLAGRRPGHRHTGLQIGAASAAGLLVLCVHVVHCWGMVMRVDAAAVALGTAGLLVGAAGNTRLVPTTIGLLLCLASLYTKQTQLAPGIALFLVTLARNPRTAALAGAITSAIGLAALVLLEVITQGGFLQNIIAENVNRMSFSNFAIAVADERRSIFVACLGVLAFVVLAKPLLASPAMDHRKMLVSSTADPALATRTMLLLYFSLCTLSLGTLFKSGASYNYLFAWMCAGCTLIGTVMVRLENTSQRNVYVVWVAALMGAISRLNAWSPVNVHDPALLQEQRTLAVRIAAATRPVASDNMSVLLQAGKTVMFDPFVASELATQGRWDEAPLLTMIRTHGFAFFITQSGRDLTLFRRTPAQVAAINEAYPRVEKAGPRFWVRLPRK